MRIGLAVLAALTTTAVAPAETQAFLGQDKVREEHINSLPSWQQPKYRRLAAQTKPGHECFWTGQPYHVVWKGLCRYNHAFDWHKVSMFGQFMEKYGADKAVDGRLDTWVNSKQTKSFDLSAWWEIELAAAVRAKAFVVVNGGVAGGILAVSNHVKGDALMTDTSDRVKRFYIPMDAGPTFDIQLDGSALRYFRLYTPTIEWRKANNIPDEWAVNGQRGSPLYVIHEVYILDNVAGNTSMRR